MIAVGSMLALGCSSAGSYRCGPEGPTGRDCEFDQACVTTVSAGDTLTRYECAPDMDCGDAQDDYCTLVATDASCILEPDTGAPDLNTTRVTCREP